MDAIKKGLREVSFAYKKKCLDTICANTSTPLCASFRTPLRARRSRLPLDRGPQLNNLLACLIDIVSVALHHQSALIQHSPALISSY